MTAWAWFFASCWLLCSGMTGVYFLATGAAMAGMYTFMATVTGALALYEWSRRR